MKTVLLFSTLVLAMLLWCCGNKAEHSDISYFLDAQGRNCQSEFYDNGNVKSTRCWIDSLADSYVLIRYDSLANKTDSLNFINGLKHGMNYQFSGDTVYKFQFDSGVQSGINTAYYPNGEYMYFGNKFDDLSVGGWKFFYPDGQTKSYEYFNTDGERVLLLRFSNDGNVERAMGYIILGEEGHLDTIPNGTTYQSRINFVNPSPECYIKCFYGIKKNNNRLEQERYLDLDSASYALSLHGDLEYLHGQSGKNVLELQSSIYYRDSVILSDTALVPFYAR